MQDKIPIRVSIHNDLPSSYVVCDTETTGLSPKVDNLLEVAILKVNNGTPSKPINKVVKIPFSVPQKIVDLTGITDQIVESEGVDLLNVLDWLTTEIQGYDYIIGHNFFAFDHHFLAYESARACHLLGKSLTLDRIIDTAVLYKGWGLKIPRRPQDSHADYARWVLSQWIPFKWNLKHACEQLEIDISQVELHRASGDVQCTYKLYDRLQHLDI